MKKNFLTKCTSGMVAMLCAAALVTASCDNDDPVDDPNRVAVTGVKVDKTTLDMAVGETATLVATVAPENATDNTVTWSSDNEAVATVSTAGKVTAVAAGNAKITVKTNDGGFTAECAVTVSAGPAVTGVTVDPTTLALTVGGTATLTATVAPADAHNKEVTWESSAPAIATVAGGVVTAVAEGTATITVTTVSGGFKATCAVTVSAVVAEPLVWEDGFEGGDFDSKWLNIDDDGDGWSWSQLEASGDPDLVQPIDGQYSILTNSWLSGVGGGTVLTPDNWAISEAITLDQAQNFILAWWQLGHDPNYAAENYGVFVSTTSRDDLSSFTQVGSDYKATNPAAQATADLTAYAGQTVYIAFRHYNISDMFSMQIDKIQVFRGTEVPAGAKVAPRPMPGPVKGDSQPKFYKYRR